MFGIANANCKMCRSNDISRIWVHGNSYLQCQTCGERWK
jgi:hypothetical protein